MKSGARIACNRQSKYIHFRKVLSLHLLKTWRLRGQSRQKCRSHHRKRRRGKHIVQKRSLEFNIQRLFPVQINAKRCNYRQNSFHAGHKRPDRGDILEAKFEKLSLTLALSIQKIDHPGTAIKRQAGKKGFLVTWHLAFLPNIPLAFLWPQTIEEWRQIL